MAIRIVRPYASEEEFLANELETLSRGSVILVGAEPRPEGVILRFEVACTTGLPLLRGEGRVLSYRDNAFRGQPGLALRFTRMDPRSKALVDRAVALRERAGNHGEASHAVATALTSPTPAPPRTSGENGSTAPSRAPTRPPPPMPPARTFRADATKIQPAIAPAGSRSEITSVVAPNLDEEPTARPEGIADREALLGRLRKRAARLGTEQVVAIRGRDDG